jgi:hypothetical protein
MGFSVWLNSRPWLRLSSNDSRRGLCQPYDLHMTGVKPFDEGLMKGWN